MQQADQDTKASSVPPYLPQISQRFQALIWSCLEAELYKSALFYAERYFALESTNHDSLHLYAIALLRAGHSHSALGKVNTPASSRCSACLDIRAKCYAALGRNRLAQEALEASLRDLPDTSSYSGAGSKHKFAFSNEAAIRCRSGTMAFKGNLPDKASQSFRQALALSPFLWEAFEGLCALGAAPEINELFPARPLPLKQQPPEEQLPSKAIPVPIVTGGGFFTPEAGPSNTLARGRRNAPQPFRLGHLQQSQDSFAANDSIFNAENTFLHPPPIRNSRSDSGPTAGSQATSRPLSSADESGPAQKKLRAATRLRSVEALKPLKSKAKEEDAPKKARARPALTFANIFSSPGRQSQPLPSTRTTTTVIGARKNDRHPVNPTLAPRRSTRLLGGTSTKPTTKHPPPRERRRELKLNESEADDDTLQSGDVPSSTSPRSDVSAAPSSGWTAAQEQQAQEIFEQEMADYYVYDLMRQFASAARALSVFDCRKCLVELEKLPLVHQQSPLVLAMVGRAHYERLEYASAERAFKALRSLDKYRLSDMEVYSTLLWHLQQNVQLSYLAQELMNINPRSPEAWISVGNLFSLQKERTQALTCFKRAAEMDSTCAYAYTLSGHESIDEDLDNAISFFQAALRADSRHYNAWYGLGTCYLRMSKIRLAEYHYRKALDIHPNNAVLLGCVGMAVERRGDKIAALSLFDRAVRIAPDNALVRYRRAKILIGMKKYSLAVEDLRQLRDSSPEESNVVFQLAKVYRLMGDEVNSAHWLAVARDMSPKSVGKIKKLIEAVKDEEEDDEMDEG